MNIQLSLTSLHRSLLCITVLFACSCVPDSSSDAILVSPPHSLTAPLVRDGDSVFFVGNSFMDYGGRPLPEWVRAIGHSVEPQVDIQVGSDIVFGNTPLREFLNHEATKAS
jgi:hypothetical protein